MPKKKMKKREGRLAGGKKLRLKDWERRREREKQCVCMRERERERERKEE